MDKAGHASFVDLTQISSDDDEVKKPSAIRTQLSSGAIGSPAPAKRAGQHDARRSQNGTRKHTGLSNQNTPPSDANVRPVQRMARDTNRPPGNIYRTPHASGSATTSRSRDNHQTTNGAHPKSELRNRANAMSEMNKTRPPPTIVIDDDDDDDDHDGSSRPQALTSRGMVKSQATNSSLGNKKKGSPSAPANAMAKIKRPHDSDRLSLDTGRPAKKSKLRHRSNDGHREQTSTSQSQPEASRKDVNRIKTQASVGSQTGRTSSAVDPTPSQHEKHRKNRDSLGKVTGTVSPTYVLGRSQSKLEKRETPRTLKDFVARVLNGGNSVNAESPAKKIADADKNSFPTNGTRARLHEHSTNAQNLPGSGDRTMSTPQGVSVYAENGVTLSKPSNAARKVKKKSSDDPPQHPGQHGQKKAHLGAGEAVPDRTKNTTERQDKTATETSTSLKPGSIAEAKKARSEQLNLKTANGGQGHPNEESRPSSDRKLRVQSRQNNATWTETLPQDRQSSTPHKPIKLDRTSNGPIKATERLSPRADSAAEIESSHHSPVPTRRSISRARHLTDLQMDLNSDNRIPGLIAPRDPRGRPDETAKITASSSVTASKPQLAMHDVVNKSFGPQGGRSVLSRDASDSAAASQAGTMQKTSTSKDVQADVSQQIDLVLKMGLAELQSDNEHWVRTWLRRGRYSKGPRDESGQPSASVFESLKPLPVAPTDKSAAHRGIAKFTVEVFGARSNKTPWEVPVQLYNTSKTREVPNYSHYVSISNNILASNETTLQRYPYFGEDIDVDDERGLQEQYYFDIDERPRKLKRLLQAQHVADYVDQMLSQIGCTWPDVLHFFLDPSPKVGSNPDALKALGLRQQFCREDFDRSQERWVNVLAQLPHSRPENIGKAAILCAQFSQAVDVPFWHIARQSQMLAGIIREQEEAESLDEDDLTCRVCMRFNCPYHGEIEDIDNNSNPSQDKDNVVNTDIVHPPEVNRRSRVAIPPPTTVPDPVHTARGHWNPKDYTHQSDARGPFYPCHHPGQTCAQSECSCFENNISCEKMCSCPAGCERRFPGCSCSSYAEKGRKGGKIVCFEDDRCLCFQLGRECDADLCGACGVCDVLDPLHRDDDRILKGRCHNANIQRGISKHTILGESGIHGFGLYACEDVREHDFVGEYKGEIITREEADRRGAVYEYQKLSYLFSLNREQEIDSTYFGNKMRFINHAGKAKANLYPRIIMVNLVHRIAMYGARRIQAGEELFFDYGPMFPDDQLGGKKAKKSPSRGREATDTVKKSIPHVRNANITKSFFDVEEQRDEHGRARMRKAVRSSSSKRAKSATRPGRGKSAEANVSEQAPRTPRRRVKKEVQRAESHAEESETHDNDAMEDAGARLQYYVYEDAASGRMDVDKSETDADRDAEDGSDAAFEPEVMSDASADESAKPTSDEDASEEEELPRKGGRGRQRRVF